MFHVDFSGIILNPKIILFFYLRAYSILKYFVYVFPLFSEKVIKATLFIFLFPVVTYLFL